MLLYLDLNCFNRPFDDQSQDRVAAETAAIFFILQRIVDEQDRLAWSVVLTYENSNHPLKDRRDEIARWAEFAMTVIRISPTMILRSQELVRLGVRALDAAHIAAAEEAGCDRFLTCDDRLLRTSRNCDVRVAMLNPIEYLEETSHV
jgi:predicted nucleic acid-binding protein